MRRILGPGGLSLLLLITVTTLALGWYYTNRWQQEREFAAVVEIGHLGTAITKERYPETRSGMCWHGYGASASKRGMGPTWLCEWMDRHGSQLLYRVDGLWLEAGYAIDKIEDSENGYRLDRRVVEQLEEFSSLKLLVVADGRVAEAELDRLRVLLPGTEVVRATESNYPEWPPAGSLDFYVIPDGENP